MGKQKRYLGQWFDLDYNGHFRHAKCIDIEFQTGFGPVFLMQTRYGHQFWLTRREMEEYEIIEQGTL